MFPNKITEKLNLLGAGCLVATGFVVPISTSLTNVLAIAAVFFGLVSGKFSGSIKLLIKNPVFLATGWMLLLMIIGLSYSSADLSEAGGVLKKYRKLLFLLMFMTLLSSDAVRKLAFRSFFIGSIILLAGSYAAEFGMFSSLLKFKFGVTPISPITHNIFMAFLAFWAAHKTFAGNHYQWLWAFLLAATTYNIFFILDGQGRTGQLIFILLAILLLLQRFRWKQRLIGIVVLGIMFSGISCFSNGFSSRLKLTKENIDSYYHNGNNTTSVGQRLDFLKTSLLLCAERPVFGHGTGSFTKEYKRLSQELNTYPTDNPHNEYLSIGVQLGLAGIISYLYLLLTQWRCSFKLPTNEYKWLAQGFVVTMAIGSLANSMIMDSLEGHFFAYFSAVLFAPLDRSADENHPLKESES